MKLLPRLVAAILALCAVLGSARAQDEAKKPAHNDYRVFTAKNGKKIEARVVTRLDGENYTVETKDGKTFNLDVTKLSASDAQFLEFWEPDAILDIASATLPEVLAKMGYSQAELTVTGDAQIFSARIGEEEMKFVLSPGRNFSTLDPTAAETLGLTLTEGRINVTDAQGNQERTKQGTVKSFIIGTVELEAFEFQVYDLARIAGNVPANTAGSIGTDLLEKLNALVDLGGKQLFVKRAGE